MCLVGAGQIFGWEAVISFILVSVVYAVAIGSPSFGKPWGPYALQLWVAMCSRTQFGCAVVAHTLKLCCGLSESRASPCCSLHDGVDKGSDCQVRLAST